MKFVSLGRVKEFILWSVKCEICVRLWSAECVSLHLRELQAFSFLPSWESSCLSML